MSTYSVSNGIIRGRTYRFRYRARNCKGWGPFSDELYVKAASVPAAPPAPARYSVSSTLLVLQLFPTIDNGGSVVTDYTLERNQGTDGSAFTEITSYDYLVDGF